MGDTELEAETIEAQKEEMERKQRLLEAQERLKQQRLAEKEKQHSELMALLGGEWLASINSLAPEGCGFDLKAASQMHCSDYLSRGFQVLLPLGEWCRILLILSERQFS